MKRVKKRALVALVLAGVIAVPSALTLHGHVQPGSVVESSDATLPALTSEHVAYIAGYPDGRMAPDQPVTRAEAVTFLYRLLDDPESGDFSCAYTDVPDDSWYASTVRAVRSLGLTSDDETFRPDDAITRAEFVAILVKLAGDVPTDASFSDVPDDYWAAEAIAKASALEWVSGYDDGTFKPENTLTRAEACAIMNRVAQRTGDSDEAAALLRLGLYSDVKPDNWAGVAIVEASIAHTPGITLTSEEWASLDASGHTFTPGIHEIRDHLYAVDRDGTLLTDQKVGAYTAATNGVLSQTEPDITLSAPYISQLDGLNAKMGCEAISALMGLQGKGYAEDISPKDFLDNQPRDDSNPARGFVGSPYAGDGRYTSIDPAPLASYCNEVAGTNLCEDISGYTAQEMQRELLAGNFIVAWQTFHWKPVRYANFYIDGELTPMVANNHVRLVCGYDPGRGYLVQNPYNSKHRGKTYRYWVSADDFESCWNERKMGMVIR